LITITFFFVPFGWDCLVGLLGVFFKVHHHHFFICFFSCDCCLSFLIMILGTHHHCHLLYSS